MDVYCKRCGEPWDLYGVEHSDMDDSERRRFWAGEGCPSCYGKQPCNREEECEECPEYDPAKFVQTCRANKSKKLAKRPFRAQLTAALQTMLGDDVDGLAAELEDAEALMGKTFWEE